MLKSKSKLLPVEDMITINKLLHQYNINSEPLLIQVEEHLLANVSTRQRSYSLLNYELKEDIEGRRNKFMLYMKF